MNSWTNQAMVASDLLVVGFAQQDDVLKLYPEAPLLSSDRAGWNSIQLQYHRHSPHQLAENYSRQHRIIICDRVSSPPLVEEMIEHRYKTKQFHDGDCDDRLAAAKLLLENFDQPIAQVLPTELVLRESSGQP